jgi:hypothetical protein
MKKYQWFAASVVLGTWAGWAHAEYVVVLKNGRQLTVQSYREEGSTVKIRGLGGELGIPKEQIQSISKSPQNDRPGLNLNSLENASRSSPAATKPPSGESASRPNESVPIDSDSGVSLQSSAGNTGAKFDKEGIKDWTADLASRIQDSQKAGGGPTSTPLAWSFPAPYTPKAKELSDMRINIEKLEKERNELIQEMKSKNIENPTSWWPF